MFADSHARPSLMQPDATIQLNDGRTLEVTIWRYPVALRDQAATLIELWRTEWQETGFDWLQWLLGVYADVLVTQTAVGWIEGAAVAAATVCYPVKEPEVSVVMNVVTREAFRGLGIANQMTDLVVGLAFRAGCTSAYLGNSPTPRSTYEKCGFVRLSGVFMRRFSRAESLETEASLFAPGQSTAVRSANWGDIPGHAALVAEPIETLILDYPRGLISARYLAPERGLTQFSTVWYDSRRSGGDMQVLIGDTAHRVLGFGSFTPGLGSANNWLANMDFVCHDAYVNHAPMLLRSLIDATKATPHVRTMRLLTAPADAWKQRCASVCGFGEPVKSMEELRLGEKKVKLMVQERRLES